jgi:hypothetical protein
MWTTVIDYENLLHELPFLKFFCMNFVFGTHNFFIVYQILAYK